MQKNPVTNPEQPEEVKQKKTKRNKRETACVDKRRMFGRCGICGGKNIVWFGVSGCNICGKEKDFIIEGYSWLSKHRKELDPGCNCDKQAYDLYLIELEFCIDCNSHEGVICPSCKKRTAWISKLGDKKFCRHCGYREG